LLGLVPVGIYVAFMWGDLRDLFEAKSGTQVDPGPFLGLWGALMLVGLVASVWSLIISLATVHVGASVAVGAPVRIGHSIRFGARRMFPLAGWGLLTVPIYLVAICLCILPVFYIAAVFTVLTTVVAAERTNAISRCFTLFHNDWRVSLSRIGTIFGISMAASAVVSTVGVPFQLAYMQSLMNVSSTNPHLNLSGGVIAGMAVFYALSFVVQALLPMVVSPLTLAAYADMRARVEPLTSAQIAQELGITA
jgi:hypothetical protein